MTDGVNGFLADVGDVETMARHSIALGLDKDLRTKMGKAGRKAAESSFHPNSIIPQYEALYEEALRLRG